MCSRGLRKFFMEKKEQEQSKKPSAVLNTLCLIAAEPPKALFTFSVWENWAFRETMTFAQDHTASEW